MERQPFFDESKFPTANYRGSRVNYSEEEVGNIRRWATHNRDTMLKKGLGGMMKKAPDPTKETDPARRLEAYGKVFEKKVQRHIEGDMKKVFKGLQYAADNKNRPDDVVQMGAAVQKDLRAVKQKAVAFIKENAPKFALEAAKDPFFSTPETAAFAVKKGVEGILNTYPNLRLTVDSTAELKNKIETHLAEEGLVIAAGTRPTWLGGKIAEGKRFMPAEMEKTRITLGIQKKLTPEVQQRISPSMWPSGQAGREAVAIEQHGPRVPGVDEAAALTAIMTSVPPGLTREQWTERVKQKAKFAAAFGGSLFSGPKTPIEQILGPYEGPKGRVKRAAPPPGPARTPQQVLDVLPPTVSGRLPYYEAPRSLPEEQIAIEAAPPSVPKPETDYSTVGEEELPVDEPRAKKPVSNVAALMKKHGTTEEKARLMIKHGLTLPPTFKGETIKVPEVCPGGT
jgi:hypothetical protein